MNTNWIQTYTGRKVFPLGDFNPSNVDILDIAHALSHICRWGGHCKLFYSVAEHSIYVSELVPPEMALDALLHDASEAYLGDIPTPLKEMLPPILEAEDVVMRAVAKKFNLSYPQFSKEINYFDKMLQITEVEQLMPDLEMFKDYRWGPEHIGEHIDKDIKCYYPEEVEYLFINRFSLLKPI